MGYRPNDKFQLTRLMRGVTQNPLLENILIKISTHTPHARRDLGDLVRYTDNLNFNSHASCEA